MLNSRYEGLSHTLLESRDALVIGLRDPETGEQMINPPRGTAVAPDAQVVYLANEPTLEPVHDEGD